METKTMNRVTAEATIENLADLWSVERGLITVNQARNITVSNALVDTGITSLALPIRLIEQLGLSKRHEKQTNSTQGYGSVTIYEAVRLTILDRTCTVEVMEVSNESSAMIEQVPLVMLDLVMDLRSRRLTGNPAHGGEHVLELF